MANSTIADPTFPTTSTPSKYKHNVFKKSEFSKIRDILKWRGLREFWSQEDFSDKEFRNEGILHKSLRWIFGRLILTLRRMSDTRQYSKIRETTTRSSQARRQRQRIKQESNVKWSATDNCGWSKVRLGWGKERYFAAIFHFSVLAIWVRYFAARISVRLKMIEIANSEGTMLCKIEKNASNNGA